MRSRNQFPSLCLIRLAVLLMLCAMNAATGFAQVSKVWADPNPSVAESRVDGSVQIVNARTTFPSLSRQDAVEGRRESAAAAPVTSSKPVVTVASSLAVVLGLFAAMIWIMRRYSPSSAKQSLPREAFEVLGSSSLDPRTRVMLVRVGSRVLVLAQTSQTIQTLSEFASLDEANRLIAQCNGSSAKDFAGQLRSFESEPHSPGFVDALESAAPRRRGLFAST